MANLLTGLRIILALPIMALILADRGWAEWSAFFLFLTAMATDYFDGRIARARNEVTSLGTALDPVADKILVGLCLVALAIITPDAAGVLGRIPFAGLTGLILFRELLVAGLRETCLASNAALPVSPLGKAKTAAQMLAVTGLLAAPLFANARLVRGVAEGILIVAAALTIISGAAYTFKAIKLLRAAPTGPMP